MIRGLYTGASGMQAQLHKMDALANNLANVDLTGYKKDTSVSKSFPQLLIRRMDDDGVRKLPFGSTDSAPVVGKLGTGVEMNELYTVFSQGSLKETSNPFDMALEGKGYFTVQTPDGLRYTRNGSFLIDDNGLLVTKDGFPVLGENGQIRLKKNNFIVDQNGKIFENAKFNDDPNRLVSMEENEWEQRELVDRLAVVDFPRDRFLTKQGNSFWAANDLSGESYARDLSQGTKVRQGFLEGSNVNPVTEMVRMIEVNRAYEANQKVIKTHDEMSEKVINQVARY